MQIKRESLLQGAILGSPICRRFLLILGVSTVIASLCNLLFPPESFFHVSTFSITLMGKYLCYALLALSVDVIWGYCGILSLGHGAFFSLGGYAMGMYLMRQIGERGVYGHPTLPDFMVFLDWDALPWYWMGMDNFGFAMLMALVVPGILAFVFGWLAFRSRVTGVYLSIITQALTYALMLAFFRNEMGFGGNNGMTDFKDILGFDLQSDTTRVVLFATTAFMLGLAYICSHYIMSSRFGKLIVCVRDAETRTRFMGYKTERFKVWLFVYSALLAAIAGALFVPQVGIINPGEFHPLNSIEVVVWVAVGGRGTLYGAIIGAILVNFAKTRFTAIMPEGWLFGLGALFVVVTVFFPEGIAGYMKKLRAKFKKKSDVDDNQNSTDNKLKLAQERT